MFFELIIIFIIFINNDDATHNVHLKNKKNNYSIFLSNDEKCLHINISSRRYYVYNTTVFTNDIEQMAKNDVFQ